MNDPIGWSWKLLPITLLLVAFYGYFVYVALSGWGKKK